MIEPHASIKAVGDTRFGESELDQAFTLYFNVHPSGIKSLAEAYVGFGDMKDEDVTRDKIDELGLRKYGNEAWLDAKVELIHVP